MSENVLIEVKSGAKKDLIAVYLVMVCTCIVVVAVNNRFYHRSL